VRNCDANLKEGCGLYIHTPFCETKCGYCDFFSVPLGEQSTHPLVVRVCRELRRRVREVEMPVRTVFIGGGTPTVLPIDQLENLLTTVADVVKVSGLDEFTVEANPATVDNGKARALKQSGVTRVSMGAQSFFSDELTALERLHSPDDIGPSVQTLRDAGIGQLNVDLIFGIPGQTLLTWKESLRRAVDLEVDHIACYGLTFEPQTRLTRQRDRGVVTPCDEELEAQMHLATIDTLAAAGYQQYEISNFAKPGCESKHNLLYTTIAATRTPLMSIATFAGSTNANTRRKIRSRSTRRHSCWRWS
jgi:oxygen-independent coproporphyrinogen-3 oxidase